MAEEIKIEIKDDSTNRSNPDLEAIFGNSTSQFDPNGWKKVGMAPPPLANNKVPISFAATPPPLPTGPQLPPLPTKTTAQPPPLPSPAAGGKSPFKIPGLMDLVKDVFPEVAVLALASDAAAKSLNMMTKNVENAGDAFATMVGNERAGAGQLGDAAASAMRGPAEAIPIVGAVIKAQNDLQDSIVKLPEKLTAAFVKQADKVSPFSGQIQGANAKADVRELLADIKEAQGLGDNYGRLIDAQSRLDNTVRELLYPIKKFVLEVLASRLELLAEILERIGKGVEVLQVVAENLPKIMLDVITASPLAAAADIAKTIVKIQEVLTKDKTKDNEGFDQFFKDIGAAKFSGNFAG